MGHKLIHRTKKVPEQKMRDRLMNNFLKIQQKLIPQVVEIMTKRYSILRQIYLCETIGRRSLAGVLKLSERVIRSETEVLREQGLMR